MIDEHLAWCAQKGLRPTYLAATRTTLRRVEREIGPLEDATEAQIEAWWAGLTIGNGRVAYAAHLSGFYRWLIWERRRDDDPTTRLIRPKQRRRLPRPITDDRLNRALLGSVPPVRTWLLLAAFAGMRACEIAVLHREDLRDTTILVHGKGDKDRIVPLHPEIAVALEMHPREGYLFPGRVDHVRANTVSQRCNRYLHGVGVTESLHQLRHWFGTSTYRASQDIRLTQELLGHSSPTTTALYAAWNPDRAAGVVGSLRVGEDPAA